jgi:hypothetical protein
MPLRACEEPRNCRVIKVLSGGTSMSMQIDFTGMGNAELLLELERLVRAERLALSELPRAAATAPVTDSPAAPPIEFLAAAPVTDSPVAASIELAAADSSGTAAVYSAPPSASTPAFALTPLQRAATRALSPGRFKLVLTLDQEQHDKLEQLRELLRHQIPDGDLAPIVNPAISELLEKKRQQRGAARLWATTVSAAMPAGFSSCQRERWAPAAVTLVPRTSAVPRLALL